MVDGNTRRGFLIDPLKNTEITLTRSTPATIKTLSLWLATYSSESVIKEAAFLADGREVARALFEQTRGEQKVKLKEPVALKALTVKILDAYQGFNRDNIRVDHGRIEEIKAFDVNGAFVPLYDQRKEYPRVPGEQVLLAYRWMKRANPKRLAFLTMSPYLMAAADGCEPAERKRAYTLSAWMCEVAGVAVYPVPGEGTDGKPIMVAEAVAELREFAGQTRPTYARIIAGVGTDPPLTPQEVRASAWMAIIQGAVGLCYETPGLQQDIDPNAAMSAALQRINGQITRLAPAILSGPPPFNVEVQAENEVSCHLKATWLDGTLYVLAQNRDAEGRTAKATFSIRRWPGSPDIPAQAQVEVVDENRTVTARDGQFADELAPLAEHVYRFAM
jgi:hypothetical protein